MYLHTHIERERERERETWREVSDGEEAAAFSRES